MTTSTRVLPVFPPAVAKISTLPAERAVTSPCPTVAIASSEERQDTGALAGSDEVTDAAFRRAGMLRVYRIDELFDAAETLVRGRPLRGERLAILTNGGGPGVLATDALVAGGGELAELAPDTLRALDALLPETWSHGNPVDVIGDAPPSPSMSTSLQLK